jgi:hypothetical protein
MSCLSRREHNLNVNGEMFSKYQIVYFIFGALFMNNVMKSFETNLKKKPQNIM